MDSRLPIKPSPLRSFRSFLNLSYLDHLALLAAILLAFFGLQSGKLLSLLRRDLHRTGDGYQVHIKRSKTDPFCSRAVISVLPSGDSSLCAVTALDSYLATQGPTEHTLFRLQTAALTRQRLNHLIRDPRSGRPLWSGFPAVLLLLLPHWSCFSSCCSWYPRLEDPSPGLLEQRLLQTLHPPA